MSKMTIIEGNSNDKDNVRAYMVKGESGDDGISPIIETSKTGGVTTITITDAEGTKDAEIEDGFSPTVTASKVNKTTTITMTDIDGTRTAEIDDGVSPIIETSKTGGVTTITITDAEGTKTATINDGAGINVNDSYSTSTTEPYSANYVNGLNTYSVSEQRIGTWIDGKPLYRKVYNLGNLPNTSGKDIATGFSAGIIRPIKIYGFASIEGSENIVFPLPNIASDNKDDGLIFYENTTLNTSVIRVVTESNRSVFTGYAILEYTKTTD